jgi:hypothetical protein
MPFLMHIAPVLSDAPLSYTTAFSVDRLQTEIYNPFTCLEHLIFQISSAFFQTFNPNLNDSGIPTERVIILSYIHIIIMEKTRFYTKRKRQGGK